MSAVNSNVSRPMPRANTGSWFLNLASDTTMFLLQMERRIDPWLRPIFDATLRDPVARIVTALMNKKRKDEGLKIAEEKLLPNEEEFLNSVIESFTAQMRGLWKPGGFERGGNTKTQGIVRGEFIVRDNLPPHQLWPEMTFTLPELRFPVQYNASSILDDAIANGHGPRSAVLFSSATITYDALLEEACRIAHVLTHDFGLVHSNRVNVNE